MFVLDEFILRNLEDDSEVISTFFILNMDVLNALQKRSIFSSNGLLDQRSIAKDFMPIIWDFLGLQIFTDLPLFLLSEILIKVLELFFLDITLALNEF